MDDQKSSRCWSPRSHDPNVSLCRGCSFLAHAFFKVLTFSHPLLSSQEDAKRIVSYSKYPPTGSRGYGPMFCPPVFGCKGSDYDAGADKNLLVIVQIESRKGVENVEEIAKVEGLDCLFIGA